MSETKSFTLESCPFCGGAAENRQSRHQPVEFYVKCTVCPATMTWSSTPLAAIQAWNKRDKSSGDPGLARFLAEATRSWIRTNTPAAKQKQAKLRQQLDKKFKCKKVTHL